MEKKTFKIKKVLGPEGHLRSFNSMFNNIKIILIIFICCNLDINLDFFIYHKLSVDNT